MAGCILHTLAQTSTDIQLKFNQIICAQDTLSHTYYCSVAPESTQFIAKVDYNQEDSLFIENTYCAPGSSFNFAAVNSKKQYSLRTYNSKISSYQQHNLIFTTLPLICLDTHGSDIIKDERTPCQFTIYDPLCRLPEQLPVFNHLSGIKVRGASASTYPKKAYSVELQDESGEETDASLLNLREDGDWILDAMYIDHARMRNRLCTDIWNSFNSVPHKEKEPEAINGTRGYFVEVILNQKYNGLYCFTEKVDRKQLKLKKYDDNYRGLSYKANTWNTLLGDGQYDADAPQNGLEWNGYESEYPGEENMAGWEYLKDFLEFCSPRYTSNSSFAENITRHVDLENIIDYTLFINAVYALDNAIKNMYLSVYNIQKDSCFFITPWDLDATFGRSYEGSVANLYAFDEAIPFSNVLIRRLYENNVKQFQTRLQERWKELRSSHLSVDSVTLRINQYKQLFETSGAFEREKALWPEKCSDIDTETAFMINWYAKNFDIMNHVILGEPLGIQSTELQPSVIQQYGRNIKILLATSYTISITDTTGRLLHQEHHTGPLTLTLPEHKIYLIQLQQDNQQAVYKIGTF